MYHNNFILKNNIRLLISVSSNILHFCVLRLVHLQNSGDGPFCFLKNILMAHIHQNPPSLSLPVLACTLYPIFLATLSFCHIASPTNSYMAWAQPLRAIPSPFVAPLIFYHESEIGEVSLKLCFTFDALIFIGFGEEQYRRNCFLSGGVFFFNFWLSI